MPLEIKVTADGSPTIYSPDLNEHYHSINGAFTESKHVFIDAGFIEKQKSGLQNINILEIGLGTGLNLMLTKKYNAAYSGKVVYHALEPYPLDIDMIVGLEKFDLKSFGIEPSFFSNIHKASFEQEISMGSDFVFYKVNSTLEKFSAGIQYDLVYFDAFGPQVQPEVWEEENFRKLYHCMNPSGILVTYCAKGAVRRSMQAVGFTVERLPGPPGKREMLRATKK